MLSVAALLDILIYAVVLAGADVGRSDCDDDAGDAQRLRHVFLPTSDVQAQGAYCNDFTPGHFYVDETDSEHSYSNPSASVDGAHGWSDRNCTNHTINAEKWVIFLEGGGVCQNALHCSSRYFSSSRRLMTSSDSFNSDNPSLVWTFPSSLDGYALLSRSANENPVFHDANRLLIPYCTSDLWVGRSRIDPTITQDQYRTRLLNSSKDWKEFGKLLAFRGVAIFRAIIKHTWLHHGLDHAKQIFVAGSSAGGIGALNQIEWLRHFVGRHQSKIDVTLAVMSDSSWFVDFRSVLSARIDPEWLKSTMRSADNDDGLSSNETDGEVCIWRVFSLPVFSDKTCGWIPNNDIGTLPINFCSLTEASYPCCLSLPCIIRYRRLLKLNDIPVLAVVSRFDAYLPSIAGQQALATISDRQTKLLQAARLIIEYGAIQFMSVAHQHRNAIFQSTFLPGCTQHVYLATSSLWKQNAVLGSVMGNVYGSTGGGQVFSHSINFDLWSKVCISISAKHAVLYGNLSWLKDCTGRVEAESAASYAVSIREVITIWWQGVVNQPVRAGDNRPFMADLCEGINCNPTCPDGIDLGHVRSDWSTDPEGIFILSCVSYLVVCTFVAYKVAMNSQRHWMMSVSNILLEFQSPGLTFPKLSASEALTVSCLEIKYTVFLQHEQVVSVPVSTESDKPECDQDLKCGGDLNSEAEQTGSQDSSMPSDTLSPSLSCSSTTSGKRLMEVKTKKRVLLSDLSLQFNPGELIAVMGPSGCGKTTFLELLTGRRKFHSKAHSVEGNIFINGSSVNSSHVLESYISNAGYVRQLATPYYEELSVRENLILAANLRLPDSTTQRQKLNCVEQIIEELGLSKFADTEVGGHTGQGLSGGQKRKLCVGLQLIELPKVLFLDEPTSGLDSTSTMDLLDVLGKVAESGRLVILSIHQPRLEVVQMFHKILFLCDGQVAFHGPADVFPGLLVVAAKTQDDQDFIESQRHVNVADQMMDMLRDPDLSEVFRSYYRFHGSQESEVRKAIKTFQKKHESGNINLAPEVKQRAGLWNRLFVWETRAGWRSSLLGKWYLAIVMSGMCLALGGAYFQSLDTLLLLTALCLWSLGSSLFMTPAIHYHLLKSLEIYELEAHDGVGQAIDVILQTFLRFGFLATIPIIVCTPLLYVMITVSDNMSSRDIFNLTASYLQLNASFTAFSIFLISINPYIGFKLAPLFSCLTGFVGGFMIPGPQMASWYKWLRFLNPNYYAFSNVIFIYLDKYQAKCKLHSKLECFPSSGLYFLQRFGFDQATPVINTLVLFSMTVTFLLMAWLTLEIRVKGLLERLTIRFRTCSKPSESPLEAERGEEDTPEEIEAREPVTFADFVEGGSDAVMKRSRYGTMRSRASLHSGKSLSHHRIRATAQATPRSKPVNDWGSLSPSIKNLNDIRGDEAQTAEPTPATARMLWRYVARRALLQSRQLTGVQLTDGGASLVDSFESHGDVSTAESIQIRAAKSDQHAPFSPGKTPAAQLFQSIVQNALAVKREEKEKASHAGSAGLQRQEKRGHRRERLKQAVRSATQDFEKHPSNS